MTAAAGAPAAELRIAGLVPLSSVDWPDHLVATVFCQGCPWRCTYCHNPAILDPTAPGAVRWTQLEALLSRRRGLLDGVVFSGGEATSQHALVAAARAVREAGFGVGLHTGGAFPARLRTLLGLDAAGRCVGDPLIDWVGFDVKAAPAGYAALVGRAGAAERAERSLRMLLVSGVDHELRMTVTPALQAQVPAVLRLVSEEGGRSLVLQRARADGTGTAFAAQLAQVPDWAERFESTAAAAERLGSELGVRVTVRP
ncbi:anaerobic ribonucleoside-triphosphate reductase activating protein [Brachybacterium sp. UNK5269]|uniref:anaerobic ribonucleoside-triphosphate reductase activating protein n=1 Tax=Brachybacterium sp. UNK5269 TaxID=3408576 RepID=UPI003BAFA870